MCEAPPDSPNTIRYSLNNRCQLMTPLIVTDLRLSLNILESVTMRGRSKHNSRVGTSEQKGASITKDEDITSK
eukprot:scaffold359769_cov28-Prasinocladus_malaysianus.AAC.1